MFIALLDRRNQPSNYHVIANQPVKKYGMVATGNHQHFGFAALCDTSVAIPTDFRRHCAGLKGIPTPVCALVRNDNLLITDRQTEI